jgi:hypothetical protein
MNRSLRDLLNRTFKYPKAVLVSYTLDESNDCGDQREKSRGRYLVTKQMTA